MQEVQTIELFGVIIVNYALPVQIFANMGACYSRNKNVIRIFPRVL